MGKMGCNPASFLQVDQDSARLFTVEQGDLSNCRNPTGAHSLAPNRAPGAALRWTHSKMPQLPAKSALLPHAMICGRAFTQPWSVVRGPFDSGGVCSMGPYFVYCM